MDQAALGAWIVISPWLYNYADNFGRKWNSVFLGVLVILLAARSANTTLAERRTHAARDTRSVARCGPSRYGPA